MKSTTFALLISFFAFYANAQSALESLRNLDWEIQSTAGVALVSTDALNTVFAGENLSNNLNAYTVGFGFKAIRKRFSFGVHSNRTVGSTTFSNDDLLSADLAQGTVSLGYELLECERWSLRPQLGFRGTEGVVTLYEENTNQTLATAFAGNGNATVFNVSNYSLGGSLEVAYTLPIQSFPVRLIAETAYYRRIGSARWEDGFGKSVKGVDVFTQQWQVTGGVAIRF